MISSTQALVGVESTITPSIILLWKRKYQLSNNSLWIQWLLLEPFSRGFEDRISHVEITTKIQKDQIKLKGNMVSLLNDCSGGTLYQNLQFLALTKNTKISAAAKEDMTMSYEMLGKKKRLFFFFFFNFFLFALFVGLTKRYMKEPTNETLKSYPKFSSKISISLGLIRVSDSLFWLDEMNS